jgi:glutamate formiminotransferase
MTEIRRQAKIYNLEIKNSEIIGLVPAAALEGVTPEFLALSGAGQRGHGFYDCFERLLFKWR